MRILCVKLFIVTLFLFSGCAFHYATGGTASVDIMGELEACKNYGLNRDAAEKYIQSMTQYCKTRPVYRRSAGKICMRCYTKRVKIKYSN